MVNRRSGQGDGVWAKHCCRCEVKSKLTSLMAWTLPEPRLGLETHMPGLEPSLNPDWDLNPRFIFFLFFHWFYLLLSFICNDFYFFHCSWFTGFCQFSTVQQGDPDTHTCIHSLTIAHYILWTPSVSRLHLIQDLAQCLTHHRCSITHFANIYWGLAMKWALF